MNAVRHRVRTRSDAQPLLATSKRCSLAHKMEVHALRVSTLENHRSSGLILPRAFESDPDRRHHRGPNRDTDSFHVRTDGQAHRSAQLRSLSKDVALEHVRSGRHFGFKASPLTVLDWNGQGLSREGEKLDVRALVFFRFHRPRHLEYRFCGEG